MFTVQGISLIDYSVMKLMRVAWRTIQKTFWYASNALNSIKMCLVILLVLIDCVFMYECMYILTYLLVLQMDSGLNVSDHLYNSDETVVKETCDEAAPDNYSDEQSDNELVLSLIRTRSILVSS